MHIKINTIRSNYEGFDQLSSIATETKELVLDTVDIDFASCGFFEANMAAPLYAILARNYDRLNDVELKNVRPSIQTILEKNHFLRKDPDSLQAWSLSAYLPGGRHQENDT